MLRELRISNFIIIEDQTIQFGPGFNAISGESGSGKSVVLQALEFVLGRRSSATLIRPGGEFAEVQALFDIGDIPARVRAELPDVIQEIEGQELLLTRSLSSTGRARVHVNGKLGTVGLLEEIGGTLLTVSSQREHMRLLEPQYHLELIDSCGSDDQVIKAYSETFSSWHAQKKEIIDLEEKLTRSVFRRAELESVLSELGEAKLRPGMRAELEAEVKRIGAGELLLSAGQEIAELLCGDEGATGVLRVAVAKLSDLSRHDHGLAAPHAIVHPSSLLLCVPSPRSSFICFLCKRYSVSIAAVNIKTRELSLIFVSGRCSASVTDTMKFAASEKTITVLLASPPPLRNTRTAAFIGHISFGSLFPSRFLAKSFTSMRSTPLFALYDVAK
ncbi:MAG: hypothetical protein EBZ48_11935 [Proteobacteria bacterium]|nr:hypothetical protein [Pseudomonadota bacterium]